MCSQRARGPRLTRSRGFTMIEVLIILAIVGLVAAMSVPAIERHIQRARITESTLDIQTMSTKIKQHQATHGSLPDSLGDVGYGNKLDPWGRAYEYMNLGNAKGNGQARKDKKLAPLNSDFDLYSIGADGETQSSLSNSKSRDDVVRARDGRFIGLAEEFDP